MACNFLQAAFLIDFFMRYRTIPRFATTGPTELGMVRIYIEADGGIELPLDFDPEEAEEIAEELLAAAEAARAIAGGGKGKAKPKKR